ncbi:MAG: GntR family transcriptional regulator [Clostridiales bacterium]|nr:GntR family transcriptional regulator [Clostridiales bacterium]
MQDKPLEKKSQSPLYQQLMMRLKNDIMAGVYPAGGRIPSEQLLCDTYSVSRVTVRKAMLDLVQEGLLVRRQGKGTFVADERIQRDLQQITSFSAACRQKGHNATAKLISVQLEEATSEDIDKLGLAQGDRVLEICRLRLSDGEPIMLEINRFPERFSFLREDNQETSLYEKLQKHGIIPSSAVHDISLGYATPLVSKHLNTALGYALLLLDEVVLDQHDEPLHLSRQWIRGDKFTFRI